MKQIFIFGLMIALFSCKQNTKVDTSFTAQQIIDKSIEVSGGDKFEKSTIDFNFRDKQYIATREQGKYSLVRIVNEDSTTIIIDELNNQGFVRKLGTKKLNDFKVVKVVDSLIPLYSAYVNSVHYFSVLPYGLNDKAVKKSSIGEEQIKDKNYYKIKVTFDEEGGGEDFEDVFIYWINKDTFKVDYLAYSYDEDNDKGMRFRDAYNERYINGLRIVDYNNYKPNDSTILLVNIGKAFEANQLKLLSRIELENVKVDLINP